MYSSYDYSSQVVLTNASNNFTGAINIYGGRLVYGGGDYNNGSSLTNPTLGSTSGISMGSQGTYGTLSVDAHPTILTPNITLNGNGGIFRSLWGWTYYKGAISGSGQLILDGDRVYLQGATSSTYSGGTRIWGSWIDAGMANDDWTTLTTADVLGTGNVQVEYGGILRIAVASNMGPAAQAIVTADFVGTDFALYSIFDVKSNFVPNFSSSSNGVFGMDCTTGANINSRLAAGQAPLGSGYMSYGTRDGGTFAGSSLLADADNVYRFAGTSWLTLQNSVLNDNTAADYGVTVSSAAAGNTFGLCVQGVNNTFTGPLTINAGATYQQRYGSTNPSDTPMGAASGNIVMTGGAYNWWQTPSLQIYGSAGTSQQAIVKNDLSFTGQDQVYLNANGAGAAALNLTTLTRLNRGTLYIDAQQGQLGAGSGNYEQFNVASPGSDLTPVNGMVSPAYTTSLNGGNFLNYGATGFQYAAYNATALASANSGSIVSIGSGGDTVPSGGASVWAVKTAGNIGGTGTLTIGSGGLIMSGNAVSISAPLNFGSAEGVIYANNNNMDISGQISGSNGLTFSATNMNTITLDGNNTSLSGQITLNSGQLVVHDKNLNALGSGSLYLNGGEINFWNYYINIPTPIILGPAGGWVTGNGMFLDGPISGTGMLYWDGPVNSGINSSNNTYSGGTYVGGGLGVSGPSALGTGPIEISRYGTLSLSGSSTVITSSQRISFVGTDAGSGNTGELDVFVNGVTVGSIEGNGGVIRIGGNYNGGQSNFTLTVGADNTSTEFDGSITDHSDGPNNQYPDNWGSIVKTGAGTWTLGGYCTYNGTTTINEGGVVFNGTLARSYTMPVLQDGWGTQSTNSTVTVGNATGNTAFLGGTGVIDRNVTINPTGTLTGTLAIVGNVTSFGPDCSRDGGHGWNAEYHRRPDAQRRFAVALRPGHQQRPDRDGRRQQRPDAGGHAVRQPTGRLWPGQLYADVVSGDDGAVGGVHQRGSLGAAVEPVELFARRLGDAVLPGHFPQQHRRHVHLDRRHERRMGRLDQRQLDRQRRHLRGCRALSGPGD